MKTEKVPKSDKNSENDCTLKAYSWWTDGPKIILELVFLLPGNPNAPQEVKFHIQKITPYIWPQGLKASNIPLCAAAVLWKSKNLKRDNVF